MFTISLLITSTIEYTPSLYAPSANDYIITQNADTFYFLENITTPPKSKPINESGFTSELRNNMNAIKKQYRSTKHKLGHLWDVVIRGNLSEIENSTKHALQAMNETNMNFNHLLHDFQNNRNVTHFYACFLKEIMADRELFEEMNRRTRLLRPGSPIMFDQMHEYGIKMFPNL